MNKQAITVGGKAYPCRLTMGAMILFKRNMGYDVSQMKQGEEADIEEMLMLMWCCIKCACRADEVEFPMDFETFACHVTPADMQRWNELMGAGNEKKKEE